MKRLSRKPEVLAAKLYHWQRTCGGADTAPGSLSGRWLVVVPPRLPSAPRVPAPARPA